jgi:hypothetical protein
MNFRMTKVLRFWVDVECERIKNQTSGRPRTDLIASILRRFEEAGDATRYLNSKRRNCLESDPRNVDEAGRCRAGGTG